MHGLEGRKAPDFSLVGSDGKTHTLGDYAGKTVVLYFYPKDDTPGCTKEACGFRDRNEEMLKAGVIILGVSRDPVESHRSFIAKYKLSFVLLADPDAEVLNQYGAYGKKKMYGKDVEGVIRSTVIIDPDGKVIKHWTNVSNAESHPEEVLQALTA